MRTVCVYALWACVGVCVYQTGINIPYSSTIFGRTISGTSSARRVLGGGGGGGGGAGVVAGVSSAEEEGSSGATGGPRICIVLLAFSWAAFFSCFS